MKDYSKQIAEFQKIIDERFPLNDLIGEFADPVTGILWQMYQVKKYETAPLRSLMAVYGPAICTLYMADVITAINTN